MDSFLEQPRPPSSLHTSTMPCATPTQSVRNTTFVVEQIRAADQIVFLGDSITQAGDEPGGYVDLVRMAIQAHAPHQGIAVTASGISGNRVGHLEERLEDDVLAGKPTLVVVFIGINDVWHSLRNEGTSKDAFASGVRDIVRRIKATDARVILCTPSVIGERPAGANPLDGMLDEYAAVTRSIAEAMGTGLIDLRRAFTDYLHLTNEVGSESGVLTLDGVHLNAEGNRFVADRMLEGLGLAGMVAARRGGRWP